MSLKSSASNVSYDNGPFGGNDAWTINFGYSVQDSFYLGARTQITEADFYVWEFPGDTMLSVDWQISGGASVGCPPGGCHGTADTTNSHHQGLLTDIYVGGLGYDIDLIKLTDLPVPSMGSGTYWLTLQNASVSSGDPVYWDENSGVGCGGWNGSGLGCPSSARESAIGTIPSESFTVDGYTVPGQNGPGETPEPGSIVLFGSGMLGMAGILRRGLME
jgi:PEP-CTERM motif